MTIHRSNCALTGMLLSAALGCAGSTGALHTRFAAVHNTLTTMGVSQLGPLSEGSLAEGATARFPVELDARCHTFVAFTGARDVELNVLDANNQRVAGDNTRDAQGTVQFCPTVRGRYTLALRMVDSLVSSFPSSACLSFAMCHVQCRLMPFINLRFGGGELWDLSLSLISGS